MNFCNPKQQQSEHLIEEVKTVYYEKYAIPRTPELENDIISIVLN